MLELPVVLSALLWDAEYQTVWLYRLATSLLIVIVLHFWFHPGNRKLNASATTITRTTRYQALMKPRSTTTTRYQALTKPRSTTTTSMLVLDRDHLPEDLVITKSMVTKPSKGAKQVTDESAQQVIRDNIKKKKSSGEDCGDSMSPRLVAEYDDLQDARSPALMDTTSPEQQAAKVSAEDSAQRNDALAGFLPSSAEASSSQTRVRDRSLAPRCAASRRPTRTTTPAPGPPPFLYQTDNHPGLEPYWYWHDVETSRFRTYAIASRANPHSSEYTAIPPYNPSGRRGTVQVHLQVTNAFADEPDSTIEVFWINYEGREEPWGRILPRQTWNETTCIDHPWVFRLADANHTLLLHYVPYRIIPTLPIAPTVDPSDPNIGVHRFTIRPARNELDACRVDDPILPFPARDHLITPQLAVGCSLLHCTRMNFQDWDLLLQCGCSILHQPNIPKYRSFRIANPHFGPRLWQNPARGVLLAIGFYENAGYAQIGGRATTTLSRERVHELSLWVFIIQQWQQRAQSLESMSAQLHQPVGAVGVYGWVGFGRAGTN